jgi:chromosome segregation ATPase
MLHIEVKGGMESTMVRRKMEDDENRGRSQQLDESTEALRKAVDTDNERFVSNQKQLTQQTIAQQDVQLDHLGKAVDRLGQIGRDVHQELKEQNVMLDAVEADMTDAGQRMDAVTEALGKLLKTKDGCQIWTIVILAVILVILGEYEATAL